MKKVMNAASNVTIAPSYVVEWVSNVYLFFLLLSFIIIIMTLLCQKREAIEKALMMEAEQAEKSEKTS
jgi:hypothetical protein